MAILSAKYGLLLPFEEIEPYNLTLNNMSIEQVKEWSDQVFEQLLMKTELHDLGGVYFHAGKRYRRYLIPMLEKMNVKYKAPLGNLGIGKQLAWYKTHNTCVLEKNQS